MAKGDDDSDLVHPRQTVRLIGQEPAQQAFLDAYRGGRMPHAWLLGGPPGIGKATFAYHAARFVLAHPNPQAAEVTAAASLAVDPEHPAARRIAAQAHPDLLVLERTANDEGKLRSVITVDEVRRTVSFFGSTAGEGGWRVCIVDSADELQYPQAANALLKVIEEPPSRSLFLLVSHAPGRLLPTIRSRCRRLTLRQLVPSEVAAAAALAGDRSADDADVTAAAEIAQGSPGRALALLEGSTMELRARVNALLAKLPNVDQRALHALGEEIAGSDAAPLATFTETVRDWLSAQLDPATAAPARLAHVADAWDQVNRAARDVEIYNLERKPLVFAVFGVLAETARR
jgi:DNA polymerase-3 subunit delta'